MATPVLVQSPPWQVVLVQPMVQPIRLFHGDGGPGEVDSFEDDIRAAWSYRPDFTNRTKCNLILRNLAGSARDEIACYDEDVRTDPEALLRKLQEAYGERRPISKLTMEFFSMSQAPGETIRSFSHRLRAAYLSLTRKQQFQGVHMTEDAVLRDQFIDGVVDKNLQFHLRGERLNRQDSTFLSLRERAFTLIDGEHSNNTIVAVHRNTTPNLIQRSTTPNLIQAVHPQQNPPPSAPNQPKLPLCETQQTVLAPGQIRTVPLQFSSQAGNERNNANLHISTQEPQPQQNIILPQQAIQSLPQVVLPTPAANISLEICQGKPVHSPLHHTKSQSLKSDISIPSQQPVQQMVNHTINRSSAFVMDVQEVVSNQFDGLSHDPNGMLGSPESVGSDVAPSPRSVGIVSDDEMSNDQLIDIDQDSAGNKTDIDKVAEKSKLNRYVHQLNGGHDAIPLNYIEGSSIKFQTPAVCADPSRVVINGCVSEVIENSNSVGQQVNIPGSTSGNCSKFVDNSIIPIQVQSSQHGNQVARQLVVCVQQQDINYVKQQPPILTQSRLSTLPSPSPKLDGLAVLSVVGLNISCDGDVSNRGSVSSVADLEKSRLIVNVQATHTPLSPSAPSEDAGAKVKKKDRIQIVNSIFLPSQNKNRGDSFFINSKVGGLSHWIILMKHLCEWANCRKCFPSSTLVFLLLFWHHLLRLLGPSCQWNACEKLVQRKWSLSSYFQDHHTSESAMQVVFHRRLTSAHEHSSCQTQTPQSSPHHENHPILGTELQVGDILRRCHPPGRHKIQDRYGEDIYRVVGVPGPTGGPYLITKEGGPLQYVTASEIRRYISDPRGENIAPSVQLPDLVDVVETVPNICVDHSQPTRRSARTVNPPARLDL